MTRKVRRLLELLYRAYKTIEAYRTLFRQIESGLIRGDIRNACVKKENVSS